VLGSTRPAAGSDIAFTEDAATGVRSGTIRRILSVAHRTPEKAIVELEVLTVTAARAPGDPAILGTLDIASSVYRLDPPEENPPPPESGVQIIGGQLKTTC
jgi:hypothetical protein